MVRSRSRAAHEGAHYSGRAHRDNRAAGKFIRIATMVRINSVDPDWGGELPATFLFDKHGQIVFKHKGRINPTELRAAIEKVLSAED